MWCHLYQGPVLPSVNLHASMVCRITCLLLSQQGCYILLDEGKRLLDFLRHARVTELALRRCSC
jgi:hypothetical protein